MLQRGVSAGLHLNFRVDSQRAEPGLATVLDVQQQEPPLRVVRGFPLVDGALLVHLHNLSGGVLGGDQLSLTLQVGAAAQAQITSTGSTRLYRHRAGEATATQRTQITVAPGGLLEYLPDSLIPFAGSRYCQTTTINLAQDAGLFYWEVVAPGRVAHGEQFQYELLRLELDLCAEGRPIALERLQLEPHRRPLSALVRLGQFSYFATFYICRVGLPTARWLALEGCLDEIARSLSAPEALWGVSALTGHGLVLRVAANNSRQIMAGLLRCWQVAKRQLYQSEAIPPRKIY
jgi:urease accessory protein